MAEELNMSQENLDLSPSAGTEDLSADLSSLQTLNPPLGAKPEALDIYKNNVGNPITGTNPQSKASSGVNNMDAINGIINATNKKIAVGENPYSRMRSFTYNGDYDGANFERYYSSGDAYDKLGFSPYRDNESLYNNKMTMGDEFVRAASQWDNLAMTGFKSGIKSWGTLFTDPLAPDLESAKEMQRAMAIGSSTKGGFGGFVTNTFLNSAYSIGIAADFLGEEMAMAAVTAYTGGLAGEVTIPGMAAKAGLASRKLLALGEMGAKLGSKAKEFNKSKKAFEASESLRKAANNMDNIFDVSSARQFYNKALTGAANIINPFENTVNAFRKTDYASDLAKTIGRSGAFIDDIIQIKTGVSEAKLEGGMVKIDATKELIDDFREKNGRDPEGDELAKIEALSSEEARRTAFWNLPAIMTSNKLLYSTMMLPISKMIGRTASGTANLIEDIATKSTKATATDIFEVTGKDAMSQIKAAGKSLIKPKFYGKYGTNYLKANFAEGIQENLQEAISQGAIQHALAVQEDPKMAAYQGYMGHFLDGMKDQASAQGFETFASGFAMGMFVQPIMAVPAWSMAKGSELFKNKEKLAQVKEERDRALAKQASTLNEIANNDIKYFAPDIINAVKNGSLSDDLIYAASEGDHKAAQDAKEDIQRNHIITALQSGKYDILLDKLADYKNLTPQEAIEAFGKYGLDKKQAVKAQTLIDDVIKRAEGIRERYEEVAESHPNPFDYTQYKKGSANYNAAVMGYFSWEEAKKNLVFAKSSFESYTNRIQSMANTFADFSNNIAKGDAQSLMSILNKQGLDKEIQTLRMELRSLGDVEGQKSVKAKKEKTLELLENFRESLKEAQTTIRDNKITAFKERKKAFEPVKKDFEKYVQFLSRKNGTVVFDTEMNKAFQILMDSYTMSNELQGLAKSINVLSSPNGFLNVQRRIQKAIENDRPYREEKIKKNLAIFMVIGDENNILNQLAKDGIQLPDEFLGEYKKALEAGEDLPSPEYFIDSETKDRITSESDPEAYDEAFEKWIAFSKWMELHNESNKLKKKKEEEEEPVKEPETFLKEEIDENDFATLPDELKSKIEALYKEADLEITIEEFAKTDPKAKTLIQNYLDSKVEEEEKTFEEYAEMDKKQLNDKLKELIKKFKTDPSVLEEKNKVEEALAFKARQEVNMTDAQKKALDSIKQISKAASNKDNEDGLYIINGKKKDMRVTKLVDNILIDKFKSIKYSVSGVDKDGKEKEGEELVKIYEEVLKDKSLKNADPKKYAKNLMTAFTEKAKDNAFFKNRFNNRKIKLIEKDLVGKKTVEVFRELLDKYAYEETNIRGNTIDKMGRNFFDGKALNPADYNMTPEAFKETREILLKLNEKIANNNEVIISNGLVLWGDTKYEVDGKPQTIAGEMDLLVIDENGEFKIYDMKTANNWGKFGSDEDNYYKKERYTLQLSLYKNLLENMTGLKVNQLELVAFKTSQDLDGKVISVKQPGKADSLKIDYNEPVNLGTTAEPIMTTIKDIVSEYVPSQLEEPVQPKSGVSDIEAEKAKVTPDEFKEIVRLAKFFVENSRKPDTVSSISSRYPELFKAVTAIEEARQESLNTIKEEDGVYEVNFRLNSIVFEKGVKKETVIEQINIKYDEELAALTGKPKTEPTTTSPTSEVKTDYYNTPINKTKASGNKVLYVPRVVVEKAYENDRDNNRGLAGQSLDNIIRRGGYAIEELDELLPNWRDIAIGKPITNTKEQESLRKKQVEAFNNFPIKEKFNIVRDQLYSDVPLSGILTNDNPTKDSLWKCRVKLPDGRFLLVTKPDDLNKVLNQEVVFENTMFEKFNNQTGESILSPAISVKLAVNGQHVAWVRTSEYKPPVDKQESIPDLSAETINKDINIESLKSAKQKGFDIEYQSPTDSAKNGRYTITEITKNSVSLTNVQGEKVVVKKEDIASSIKEVIDPKGVKGKKETIDTMANNQKTVATLSISLTPGISKSDALNNILNSKC